MGDAQSAKRAAAVAYDYEGDPRWTEYWSNVLIPPHMAFRSDVIDHFKLKFYHRFVMCRLFHMFQKYCILPHKKSMWSSCYHFCHRHVAMIFDDTIQDPEFVVANMSSARSSQSTRASTTCSSTPMREHTRPQNSGAISGGSAASNRSLSSLQLDKRTIHFSVNAWVLIVAFLGVLPIVPRNLSSKAFRLSLLGTALSSFYSLYSLYGKPRTWNLHGVQSLFQLVIATKDFIHFTYCLMLIFSRVHFKFALIPVIFWVVEHVAKFLRCNFSRSSFYRRYFEKACLWVEANTNTLNILCSNAEIALGFLLVISLLSWQRNILQTFMYWQILKLMYNAPATAGYHQSVWAKIGQAANPYIYRYAPFLNTPISTIQRWWFL